MTELIKFNMETRERNIMQFDEYYKVIGYIKNHSNELRKGIVFVISDTAALNKYMADKGGLL